MPSLSPIPHVELAAVLARMRLGTAASQLHGSLIGYLCGGGEAGSRAFLSALELESNDAHADDAGHALLADLYAHCQVQLADPDLGFAPLLPDAERPLFERGDALVDWCSGFLGGLGLAGFGRRGLSEEGAEILRDFNQIAASHFSYDADNDEDSLAEVFEFVRIGVLLLYGELRAEQGPRVH
ncbi:MAG: UPF0149 family protein [Rhodanobacteraceae bacterium]|nr:UPF0149 family protein [Pseudomonadota bacterium]